MIALLKLVKNYLPNKYKREFLFAFLLLLFSGIAEIISIASILPFLSLLDTGGVKYINNSLIFDLLPINFSSLAGNIYFLTFIFCFSTVLAATIRLSSIWCNSLFAAKVGSFFSNYLFRETIKKEYEYHVNQNTNILILTLTQHINGTVRALFYLLQFFSGIIISFFIIAYLTYLNPILSLFSFLIFGSYYLIIAKIFKLKLVDNSKYIANIGQIQMKLVRESLGGIREIILNEDSKYYSDIYKKNDKSMRYRQAVNQFISIFPRYSLEAIAIISIILLGVLFNKKEFANIAMLGSIAFGAQRLLPALQSIYSAWAMLKNFSADIKEVNNAIVKIGNNFKLKSNNKPIKSFKNFKLIKFKNINYQYKNRNKVILRDCNLSVRRGETIAIIGKTGSGKSTFVDILMGLLNPLEGEIQIDGNVINKFNREHNLKEWRKCISHVPQEVFLRNETIYRNIVGTDFKHKNDDEKFILALNTSQVTEFIDDLDNGLDTLVGERGVKISGGQKQRIGVARALMKDKPILVLDESTSSLDTTIEKRMLDNIKLCYPLLTILMITHRHSNLSYCDKVFEIKKGMIKEIEF